MVHIEVRHNDKSEYYIKTENINEIADSAKLPFDLLLLDFGYRHKDVTTKQISEELEKCNSATEKLVTFNKYILNPQTITESPCKPELSRFFIKNFCKHKGPIIVYSYFPDKFIKVIPFIDISKQACNIVKKAFTKSSKISFVNTKDDLFAKNEDLCEKLRIGYDYDFIMVKFLEQLVRIEIVKKMIRAKYRNIVTILTVISVLSGAITIGSFIRNLF